MITPLERILLERYDSSNPKLQEPPQALVSLDKSQASPAYNQATKAAPEALQSLVYKNGSRTATVYIVMSADEYPVGDITDACRAFNQLNKTSMSHSYQLLVPFEGIPTGSWVYVKYDKEL